MYYKGEGTEVDRLKGLRYLVMAAKVGHSESYAYLKELKFVD